MKTVIDNIKIKYFLILTLIIISIFVSGKQYKKPVDNRKTQIGYIPKDGFIPDKATAIKVAEAVWLPIYGDKVKNKKPYKIKLENGVWYIEGTLPQNCTGGVPYIEIQKKDGKVLKVMHGK